MRIKLVITWFIQSQRNSLSNFKTLFSIILPLFFCFQAFATEDIHIVFDLDWTLINPTTAVMAKVRPKDTFEYDGVIYRFSEHTFELLIALHRQPQVKISFFSGGADARNKYVVGLIYQRIHSTVGHTHFQPTRVLSKEDLSVISTDTHLKFSERYKKDLSRFFDLKSVVLVDDIKNFVPISQEKNQLWIGKTYIDRPLLHLTNLEKAEDKKYSAPNEQEWLRNKNKLLPISKILLAAIYRTRQSSTAFVDNIPGNCAALF